MHILKMAGALSVAALLACGAAYAAGNSSEGARGSTNATSGTDNTKGSPNAATRTTGRDTLNNTGGRAQWDTENTYWRNHYSSRPYYNQSRNYSTMEPAYRYGVDLYNRNTGRSYDDLNTSELERGWNQARGNSNLNWDDAQKATRDAYNRLHENRNGASGSNTGSNSGSGSSRSGR